MPVVNTTPPAAHSPESVGLALLRRAAADDDAFREDCCPMCHSADLKPDTAFGADWMCTACGWTLDNGGAVYASHLADALKCYDDPFRKIERPDIVALIEHAALVELRLAEMAETLAAERARMRSIIDLAFSEASAARVHAAVAAERRAA